MRHPIASFARDARFKSQLIHTLTAHIWLARSALCTSSTILYVHRPAGVTLDLRVTSFKKLTRFLSAKADAGIIKCKCALRLYQIKVACALNDSSLPPSHPARAVT